MTVLLVILAVVGIVAAMLAAVLLSPLSVRIRYGQTLEVYAGLSFVKFKVFPKKEKKKKEKIKTSIPPSAKSVSKTPETKGVDDSTKNADEKTDGQKANKKELSDTLKLVFEIIKSVFDVMGKRASIKIDELHAVISKPDAADTAVAFGLCGGILSNILAFTSNFRKAVINDKNIGIEPDFVTGKSRFSADITISIMAGALLYSLIRGYLKGVLGKK
ncbi:MAG: DUF2953 domain-containing protein [Clostridia bacterium]|nr:DUF2953 domain-containing protein [Clostridia bacterium]